MICDKNNGTIREAVREDYDFVVDLMESALGPYYGGDHIAHAKRIFWTHISGGKDRIGFFSYEQKMFILSIDTKPAGMIHLVGKRQGTYKISPIIVSLEYQGKRGLGSRLLHFGEQYARSKRARQLYCTVAEENKSAAQFFIRKGFTIAGRSASHYKIGVTELMMYKILSAPELEEKLDRPHISVLPCSEAHEPQVRDILLKTLPKHFRDIDSSWVNALFMGYNRRFLQDINEKFKLIYVALDRQENVLGVAGATPKKGEPIKVMPFIATTLPAFLALLIDVPYMLKKFGRKAYIHLIPTVDETIALQQQGWKLDAVLPGAYHNDFITQQWSYDISGEDIMRTMRVKQNFLSQIKSEKKTLEVRVGYDNIKTIQPGERIRLMSRNETQFIRVNAVRRYKSIDEMMIAEDYTRIAPGMSRSDVYSKLIEIYPPSKQALGVIVLDIRIEDDN